jgi:hypothetical protein
MTTDDQFILPLTTCPDVLTVPAAYATEGHSVMIALASSLDRV